MLSLSKVELALALALASILLVSCSIIIPGKENDQKEQLMQQYLDQAESHRAEFNYDESLIYLKKALQIKPNNSEIIYKIGLVYGIKHGQEGNSTIIGGRRNQQGRIKRHPESSYIKSVRYLKKAADMGHVQARQLLRALHNNIQHLDVKY